MYDWALLALPSALEPWLAAVFCVCCVAVDSSVYRPSGFVLGSNSGPHSEYESSTYPGLHPGTWRPSILVFQSRLDHLYAACSSRGSEVDSVVYKPVRGYTRTSYGHSLPAFFARRALKLFSQYIL